MLDSVLSVDAQDASKTAEELGKRWLAGYDSGDAEGIAGLFTAEVSLIRLQEPNQRSPEALRQLVNNEIDKWVPLIKEAGIVAQ
jgi:hypothetical protein